MNLTQPEAATPEGLFDPRGHGRLLVSADGRLLASNQAGLRMLAIDPATGLGKPVDKYLDLDSIERIDGRRLKIERSEFADSAVQLVVKDVTAQQALLANLGRFATGPFEDSDDMTQRVIAMSMLELAASIDRDEFNRGQLAALCQTAGEKLFPTGGAVYLVSDNRATVTSKWGARVGDESFSTHECVAVNHGLKRCLHTFQTAALACSVHGRTLVTVDPGGGPDRKGTVAVFAEVANFLLA